MVYTEEISIRIRTGDFVNITEEVRAVVKNSGIKNGICTIFSLGSTGSVIINEDESNLIRDLKNTLEKIAPSNNEYNHPENAFSHIRTALLGPSKNVIIKNSDLVLGTWQEILFYNGDTSTRDRRIIVSVLGE